MTEPELPSLFATTPRRWAMAGELGKTPETSVQSEPPVTEGLALFEQPETGESMGYERWKAETSRACAEAEAARRAEELPMREGSAGYETWKRDAEEARHAFERRWGVPLGKRVRVVLVGERHEREGVLRIVEGAKTNNGVLQLRMGQEVFAAGRIESVVRL
ncbi:MAG: hypothetical protein R3F13_17965 [Prosthecobacter sp.]